MDRLNRINNKASIILHTLFIICTICCIAPFILILSVSLTDETALVTYGYKILPIDFSLYAYEYILKSGESLLRSYGITIFSTVVGTVSALFTIALFAYPLSRKDFKYGKAFSLFVFFTMIFNGGLVPWYYMYSSVFHLKNTLLIYIIPHLMSAWYVIIMKTFFSTTIPDSIIESAKIDGANEFRTFFSIVLPLAKPGLATVALFLSVTIWNDYWIPLVFITKSDLFNVQYAMYSVLQNAQYLAQNVDKIQNASLDSIPLESIRMAMGIIGIGPIILAYPFFQKYFIKGLTVGAIKE